MNYTTGKFFLDTNFLVYLLTSQDAVKKDVCQEILSTGREKGVFVISTQVIQEFIVVLVKKLGYDPRQVKDYVSALDRLEVVQVDMSTIQAALDNHIIYGFSFWDALIVAAAHKANCNILLTEDLTSGQVMGSLKVYNPF